MDKNMLSSNNMEPHFKIYITDFFRGVQKLWWVCIALAVMFGGALSVRGILQYKPVYSSSATFVVSMQSSTGAGTGLSQYSYYYDTTTAEQLASTFPHILSSNLLQEIVCTELGTSAMPASVSASVVTGTNMFKLTTVGTEPQLTYDTLVSVIDNYPLVAKHVIGNIKMDMITSPVVPQGASNSPEVKENFITGASFGLLAGVICIFLYAILRNTIRSKDEISSELNSTLLGSVPQVFFKRRTKKEDTAILVTNEKLPSGFNEAVRVFRNIFMKALKDDEKVVLVTSTAPSEGKTTVITNLALSLSSRNKKVLLIDADLRNPSVAPLLNLDMEAMQFQIQEEKYRIADLQGLNISFLEFIFPEERKNDYVSTAFVKSVFDDVRDAYDYILVDTPPCGLVSDSMFIAQAADAAIYVVHQDAVRVSKIRSSLNNLLATDVRVLGCVLNGVLGGSTGYGYGYGYKGYGYGYKGYGYGKYGKYGYGYGYGEEKNSHKVKNDD